MKRFVALTALALGMISLSAYAEDKADAKAFFKDPEQLFSKIDSDGDKKISKEELTKFFSNLPAPKLAEKSETIAAKMFERLDTNTDGSLSMDEFKKLAELKKLDPEKLKELKGLLKKKKGEPEAKPEAKETPKTETDKK